jgi:hypothetical protein
MNIKQTPLNGYIASMAHIPPQFVSSAFSISSASNHFPTGIPMGISFNGILTDLWMSRKTSDEEVAAKFEPSGTPGGHAIPAGKAVHRPHIKQFFETYSIKSHGPGTPPSIFPSSGPLMNFLNGLHLKCNFLGIARRLLAGSAAEGPRRGLAKHRGHRLLRPHCQHPHGALPLHPLSRWQRGTLGQRRLAAAVRDNEIHAPSKGR